MARMSVRLPAEFEKHLGKLADVERYAAKMLEEAVPILIDSVKSTIKSVISAESTGDLVESIKKTKAYHAKNGGFLIQATPTGKDKKGVRNVEKAMYKQYGTKRGEVARPWLEKSANDVEQQVIDKMQEVFNREVDRM